MPSELAFLFQNDVPQGLHPGSGDYTFMNSCNIICINMIFLFFSIVSWDKRKKANPKIDNKFLQSLPFQMKYLYNIKVFNLLLWSLFSGQEHSQKIYLTSDAFLPYLRK